MHSYRPTLLNCLRYKLQWLITTLCLSACQQLPCDQGHVFQSSPFKHRIIHNHKTGHLLTVYIEGDGAPWRSRYVKADNPSPTYPLLLPIMLADKKPALYLGRPCYYVEDTACSSIWWTEQRYAESIVNSMSVALKSQSKNFQHLIFIGLSGGATLATLLAAKHAKTIGLITIAGNLDIERWV
ncbi:MAG: hypothetical protein HRU20_14720 [Pseudomonadales bacterium]|nr:hypothetical protein [Pseudomonadales bacterium]